MWKSARSERHVIVNETKLCSSRMEEIAAADSAEQMVAALLTATQFTQISDIDAYVKSIETIVYGLIAPHVDVELRRPARFAYHNGMQAGVLGASQYVADCSGLSHSGASVLLLKKIWMSGFSHGRSIRRCACENAELRRALDRRLAGEREE